MLDFNHHSKFHEHVGELLDAALVTEKDTHQPRDYLGASRLGVACARALQFEHTRAPMDPARALSGRLLRVFEVGHVLEDLAVRWLRLIGFDLHSRNPLGDQFGFSAAQGRIQGHIDGVLRDGPARLGMCYPALWECKTMNNKSWRETVKNGVAKSKPVYAAQMAIYQAYMEASIPGLAQNPALFTAINKDTQEVWCELVPFDSGLAQHISDRAVRLLTATDAGEMLPRISSSPSHPDCRFCSWQERCWRES